MKSLRFLMIAVLTIATAHAQITPAARVALQAQRTRLTAQITQRASSQNLCALGDVERQLGDRDAATRHFQQAIQTLPAPTSGAQETARLRTEFSCRFGLARAIESNNPHEASQELERVWPPPSGVTLPTDFRTWSRQLFRRALSGGRCIRSTDDDVRVMLTESRVLRHLADGDSPELRACLGAVRARQTRTHRGLAAPAEAPTPAFARGATGWTRVDAQTGWHVGDTGLVVARTEGRTTRYAILDGTIGEGGTVVTARWMTVSEQPLLVVHTAVTESTEDLRPGQGPMVSKTVFVLNAQLQTVGHYVLAYAAENMAVPAHPVVPGATGAWPIRIDGDVLVIGTMRLLYIDGALASAS
jgi:hypothetical protein